MELLDLLASDDCVSGERIAGELKISRAAVHKRITRLRALGYEIAGERKHGYRLVSRPDLITHEELAAHFPKALRERHPVLYYPEIASTQVEAKTVAAQDGTDGMLIVAERQSASYGRMRRAWSAPGGGIWFSLVLKPEIPPERVAQLTLVMSLALCRSVERLGLKPDIKWPNDIQLGGKKLAGILTEMSAEIDRVNWVVIGVGMNANNELPDPVRGTAVSLAQAAGKKIGRPQLLAAVMTEFDALYEAFRAKGFEAFEKEYNERSILHGREITVRVGAEPHAGVVEKIDAAGYLWLRRADGTVDRIIAGDVATIQK